MKNYRGVDVHVYLRIELHSILVSHFINKETGVLTSFFPTVVVLIGNKAQIYFPIQFLCHACIYQNILFIRPTVFPKIAFCKTFSKYMHL